MATRKTGEGATRKATTAAKPKPRAVAATKKKAVATEPKPRPRPRAVATKPGESAARARATEAGGATEAPWWTALEAAWKAVAPEQKATRRRMAANRASEEEYDDVEEALEEVVTALQDAFDRMAKATLLEVDRALERVLYRLDRQDIQEVTDGSDDGFLYCRGFIAAIGQEYADAVDADPSVARVDREQGDVAYLPLHAYERRFGRRPASAGISRESCSNREGWPG